LKAAKHSRQSVAVTIAGQPYVLRSDAEEAYVREVAGLVDRKLRHVARTTRTVATHKLAILTALQLADDLLREKRGRAELRRRVRERSRRMLAILHEGAGAAKAGRAGARVGEG
jgi:cell division protein ZapA